METMMPTAADLRLAATLLEEHQGDARSAIADAAGRIVSGPDREAVVVLPGAIFVLSFLVANR